MQREGQMAHDNSSFWSSPLLPLDTRGLLKQPLSHISAFPFSFLSTPHIGTTLCFLSPHFLKDRFISRVVPNSLPDVVRTPQLGQNLMKVSFSPSPAVGLLVQHSQRSPFTGGLFLQTPPFPAVPHALSPSSGTELAVWAWPSCWASEPQFPHLPKETTEAPHPTKLCVTLH